MKYVFIAFFDAEDPDVEALSAPTQVLIDALPGFESAALGPAAELEQLIEDLKSEDLKALKTFFEEND